MANPTLYKKIPNTNLQNRQVSIPDDAEDTRMSGVIHKFFELFKAKHLS